MRVLIAFATSRGSTQGIAERLATRLQDLGIAAVAQSVTEPRELAGYDAVVLGSAVHGGRWLPEASRFVSANTAWLARHPVWLFSVSTLGDRESMFPPRVAKTLRAMRKETEEITSLRTSIRPRAHRNFAGAIARADWGAPGRAFFRATGGRYGDHRNWAAVDAWAETVARELTFGVAGDHAATPELGEKRPLTQPWPSEFQP